MNRIAPLTVIAFAGILPLLPISVAHADTFTWLNPVAGSWNTASCWSNNAVPPTDGTATVVFPSTNTIYAVTLPGTANPVNVLGIMITAPVIVPRTDGNSVKFQSGTLKVGAGGVTIDDSTNSVGLNISCGLELTASQTWKNKSYNSSYLNASTLISGSITAAEGIVWTISGPMPLSLTGNASAFKGKLRTNCSVSYGFSLSPFSTIAASGAFEWYGSDEPYARPSSSRIAPDQISTSNELDLINAPITLDLTDSARSTVFHVPQKYTQTRWLVKISSPLSGVFQNKKLQFTIHRVSDSTKRSHFPRKQRNVLCGDNSGLSTAGNQAIGFPDGVFEVGHTNALGLNNVLPVYFGGDSGGGGFFTGLTAQNGVTIRSDVEVSTISPEVLLGSVESGEVHYTGSITNPVATQIFLQAVTNSTAYFEGNLSCASTSYAYELCGGGDVVLSGDNSGLKKGLNVRSARALLASDSAAGPKPIQLGGVVPFLTNVTACCGGRWNEQGYTFTETDTGKTNYTTTATSIVFDGVTLNVGDTFLYLPDVADGTTCRIFKLIEAQKIALEKMDYAEGMRIYVEQGADFGGRSFMGAKGTTAKSSVPAVEELSNPDVAVLTFGARAITNDVVVSNNWSTGTSTIGGTTADASEFSGAITLRKSVVFSAVSNGTVTVSGGITGAGDFTKKGQGTVALTGTISATGGLTLSGGTLQMSAAAVANRTSLAWNVSAADGTGTLAADGFSFAGKTITLNVSGTLDKHDSYVLATGTTGIPSVSNELPTGWKLSAGNNSLKFYYPATGMTLRLF